MARLLKKGLEEENHIVMLAHNGVEGLELSRTYPFDVIILDIMLPGITGFEVARQLRQSSSWLNGKCVLIWRDAAGARKRYSLGTSDPREAQRRAPAVHAELTRPIGKSVADLWNAYRN